MRKKAILISNVKHAAHQIDALAEMGFEVDFFGLRLFSPKIIRRMASIPMGQSIADALQQRRGQWPTSANFHGLGPGTYTPAIANRLKVGDHVRLNRLHLELQRAVVHAHMRKLKEARLVHFVEGLGQPILKNWIPRQQVLLVERRSLHPTEMAKRELSYGGFPDIEKQMSGVSHVYQQELTAARAVVVYSELAKQSFVENGVPEKRVWVVPIPFAAPNELPPANAQDNSCSVNFMFLGACQSHKGIDVAVKAVSLLGANARLMVAGYATAPVQSWLQAQPMVRYLGILGKQSIESQFSRTAALVVPSKESLGLAILEAVRARVPCIISSKSGIAATLARYAPECIVHSRDPREWRDRLAWVSTLSTARRDELTKRSYECLKEFSYVRGVDAQRSVYESVMS